jgi:hypothetical protein
MKILQIFKRRFGVFKESCGQEAMFQVRRQKVQVLAKGDLYASYTHLYTKVGDVQGIFHNTIYANATFPSS